MLLHVVNPNTTSSMTDLIASCARSVAAPGTGILATTSAMGPESIESHYDEALSVPGLLTAITAAEAAGAQGHVIACFGDPGLDAAREVARGPVVGIAEAAMRTAAHLGRTFSVVTTLGRTTGRAWDLADRYGLRPVCRAVHAVEISVLDLDRDPGACARVEQACRRAVAEDDCDAIVLGCAGMADLAARLSATVGVPVVDGVAAGVVTVEGLVRLGLATPTRGEFAPPPAKRYTGLLADFAPSGPPVASAPPTR